MDRRRDELVAEVCTRYKSFQIHEKVLPSIADDDEVLVLLLFVGHPYAGVAKGSANTWLIRRDGKLAEVLFDSVNG
jgi:hypothetical protein